MLQARKTETLFSLNQVDVPLKLEIGTRVGVLFQMLRTEGDAHNWQTLEQRYQGVVVGLAPQPTDTYNDYDEQMCVNVMPDQPMPKGKFATMHPRLIDCTPQTLTHDQLGLVTLRYTVTPLT